MGGRSGRSRLPYRIVGSDPVATEPSISGITVFMTHLLVPMDPVGMIENRTQRQTGAHTEGLLPCCTVSTTQTSMVAPSIVTHQSCKARAEGVSETYLAFD